MALNQSDTKMSLFIPQPLAQALVGLRAHIWCALSATTHEPVRWGVGRRRPLRSVNFKPQQ